MNPQHFKGNPTENWKRLGAPNPSLAPVQRVSKAAPNSAPLSLQMYEVCVLSVAFLSYASSSLLNPKDEPKEIVPGSMEILAARLNAQRQVRTLSRPIRVFSSCVRRQAQWGFIGLGAMGYPMAMNLLAKIPKTDQLIVCDTNGATTDSFLKEVEGTQVQVAWSPQEAAEKSDTVITVLPEPQHVKSVFEEILSSPLPPAPTKTARLYIDCSTIDPTTSRSVASSIQSSSSESLATLVDAPMSGGVVGARAGTLTFMMGCNIEMAADVEKTLLLMGKKVWHLGTQGAGLSGKLANNYALAINNIGAAEAMNLGLKWGLDPTALGNLINSSTGRSWPSEINNPVPGVVEAAPASRNYEGGFGVSLMKKDLKLAIRAAQEAGARLELATKADEIYGKVEGDYKGKDFSVVYQWLSRNE